MNLSDISRSFFVAANAGSGKTTNLISRLVSLIFAGVKPSKILCTTYTNAGANELTERLGSFFLNIYNLNDAEAVKAIKERALIDVSPQDLPKIRGIIHKNFITKELVQISTFHGFCKALIHKFSIETNTLSNASLLEDINKALILKEIQDEILQDEAVLAVIKPLLQHISIYSFERILKDILNETRKFFTFFSQKTSLKDIITELYERFGVEYFTDLEAEIVRLETELYEGVKKHDFQKIYDILAEFSGKTVEKRQAELKKILQSFRIADIQYFCLTDEKIRSITHYFTKSVCEKCPEICEVYEQLQETVYKYAQELSRIKTVKFTESTLCLAYAFFARYEERKRQNGLLDYDDLIFKAKNLLERHALKDWIIFKLDGQFEHILVDEAQDTNLLQWSIIDKITEEFFAGQGAFECPKTLTVVGDAKQSIYSFQGAQSFIFNRVFENYKTHFTQIPLHRSFRSTKPVLGLAQMLTGVPHEGVRDEEYGRVEVLKAIVKSEEEDEFDALASQISEKIFEILARRTDLKPQDIMILMRKRTPQFTMPLGHYLAQKSIFINDLSRKKYIESFPIMDFVAFARFLLYNLDYFSLACVLKSPIFELENADIEAITEGGKISLQSHAKIQEILHKYAQIIKKSTPLDFFATLDDEFKNKYTRQEEGDFEKFFDLISSFQKADLPNTLEHFLNYFAKLEDVAMDEEVYTEGEAENYVKISTIHGAKGLESPIVIIPNAGNVRGNSGASSIKWLEDESLNSFVIFKDGETEASQEIKTHNKSQQEKEDENLLYVAVTRAKDELYVGGIISKTEVDESWFSKIRQSVNILSLGEDIYEHGTIKKSAEPVYTKEDFTNLKYGSVDGVKIYGITEFKTISPSQIEVHETEQTSSKGWLSESRLEYGDVVHKVFENIKILDNHDKIINFLQQFEVAPKTAEEIAVKTMRIRQSDFFVHFLSEDCLIENEFVYQNPDNMTVFGRFDMLLVGQDKIVILDIKTNENLSQDNIPPYILAQMKAYKDGVSKIYPTYTIETVILSFETESLILLS